MSTSLLYHMFGIRGYEYRRVDYYLLSAHVPRHFWSFLFVGYSDVQVTGRRASRLVALVNAD